MLIELKALLHDLAPPPASLLLLGLAGVALLGRRPRAGRWLVAVSLLSLWLVSTTGFGFAIYRLTEKYPPLDPKVVVQAGAIVLLGGGATSGNYTEWGGPVMMDIGWDRLAYAALLTRRTGLPLLVTGGKSDRASMANALRSGFGIEARWVDDGARDTWENAERTARVLRGTNIRRIVLVTHSSHMARAVAEFEAVGFSVVPAPVAVLPGSDTASRLDNWLPSARGLLYANMGLYELIAWPVSAVLRKWRHHEAHVEAT